MGEQVTIRLIGRIDSGNAAETEKKIVQELEEKKPECVILDASELAYISSAGLRVVLRVKKSYPDMKLVNVSSEVYEILETTGFTEIMTVEKAYKTISVEGCEEIGRGAKGILYRIDQDNVVKVYQEANALEDIRHEREMAKLAFVLGLPTAISYDIVRVGDSYGSVFELLNAESFAQILSETPEKMDWCVEEYAAMLKRIHETHVPAGKVPDMKEKNLFWVSMLHGIIPEEAEAKLRAMVEEIPEDDRMIHGDYHPKNIELMDGEVLLIDMDTLSSGYPLFEFGQIFNSLIGFSEVDPETVKRFQGFDLETSKEFWHRVLAAYLGTKDEEAIRAFEAKAKVLGYLKLLRRLARDNSLETENGKKEYAVWKEHLMEVLAVTDTLLVE